MQLPESLTDRLPFLEALEDDWDPIPRLALVAWSGFYFLFLYQAARGNGLLLLMDGVFVPIHEGGHLLFRFFGEFLNIAGGTLLQLGVPIALAIYFLFQRQAQGVAFCMFFFFEQFLPIATYMADARAQDLPLLTIGDGDYVIHDWNYLFGKFGMLRHDVQIAGTVRFTRLDRYAKCSRLADLARREGRKSFDPSGCEVRDGRFACETLRR